MGGIGSGVRGHLTAPGPRKPPAPVVPTAPLKEALQLRFGGRIPYKDLAPKLGISRSRMHQILGYQNTVTVEMAKKIEGLIHEWDVENGPILLSKIAAAQQAYRWWLDRMGGKPEESFDERGNLIGTDVWGRASFLEATGLSPGSVNSSIKRGREDVKYRNFMERRLWMLAWGT